MSGLTVTKQIHFSIRSRGRKEVTEGSRPAASRPSVGRVPRLMRLMALAIHLDDLIARGAINDQAEAAAMGHVTRARMTQLLGLMRLAPDVRLAIMQLPHTKAGRDPISERHVRALTLMVDWDDQRRAWEALSRGRGVS